MAPGVHVVENGLGDRATVLEHGARLAALHVVTAAGPVNVVLGHADPDAYRTDDQSLGAVVGRCANRISGAAFVLEGVRHELLANEPPNHLHGGPRGFGCVPWHVDPDRPPTARALTLRLVSSAGDQGYPGTLTVHCTYRWRERELTVHLEARTDAPTVVNLTHHAYFNLNGGGDVRDHGLVVHAKQFTPTDDQMVPTGELREVAGTALDFTSHRRVGQTLAMDDPEIAARSGVDHNYVLPQGGCMPVVASVHGPRSGVTMELATDQPCLQVYTGNGLGDPFGRHGGLCLEPQAFPDAINQPGFPDPILRPGDTYHWHMKLRFHA